MEITYVIVFRESSIASSNWYARHFYQKGIPPPQCPTIADDYAAMIEGCRWWGKENVLTLHGWTLEEMLTLSEPVVFLFCCFYDVEGKLLRSFSYARSHTNREERGLP